MVEVLVTTAVTVVAFAGLATLQVLSLRAADSALDRTQASTLASEMMERMRANRGEKGVASTALNGDYNGKTLCKVDACDVSAVDCGEDPPTNAIDRDLEALWCALEQSGMPNWYAAIQAPGDPSPSTVAIRWDDSRAEAKGSTTAADRPSCLGGTIPAGRQEVCLMTQL